jgi:predicted AlkP superfamily pyrophosphatase or phosphodiesterase
MKVALAGCALWFGCSAAPNVGTTQSAEKIKEHGHRSVEHVLLLSIDGFHDFDLTNYVASHPTSALASLVARGTVYSQAYSTGPSDSFPATLAITTGGSPSSTGVYYDATWDDNLSPPGSNCATRGTAVTYKENINFVTNSGATFADINPALLPRDPNNGCTPVYPHQYLKVNTIYEVIHNAGLRTAVTDKHPSYEMLSGPSGTGLDDFYGPEFNAGKKDIAKTMANDDLRLTAVLHQLDGFDHTGTTQVGVPAILGMNFQGVNIAQKFSGYLDADGAQPNSVYVISQTGKTPGLVQALDHADQSIQQMLDKMDANGLTDSTLVIMAAKHGNSPVDASKFVAINPDTTFAPLINTVAPGLTATVTADTMALIWLTDHSRANDVAHVLRANSAAIGGGTVYVGHQIDALLHGQLAGNPGRHPDIIVQPDLGVVYTTVGSKICDHGGLNEQDRHVAMVIAGPHVQAGTVSQEVTLQMVAPTILKAFGLKPHDLDAVRREHTHRLPVADDDRCDDGDDD